MPTEENRYLKRCPGVHIIYKVTASLPVSHSMPGLGTLTLAGEDRDAPPYSRMVLRNESGIELWHYHCTGHGHAEHTIRHGLRVPHATLVHQFLRVLVAANKAEVVCGSHSDLYWMAASLPAPSPQYDAFYTFGETRDGRAARFGMLCAGELPSSDSCPRLSA